MPEQGLARRNILITGASAGLGEGMARLFAAAGHNLALTARRLDRLEALRDELSARHPGIVVVCHQLDVNDHDAVFTVFEKAAADLGGLDRVIVNAGLGKGGRVGSGKFAANRQTAETNFVAALAQCEAAMTHFYARKSGHLVIVSSMSAMRGMPGAATVYAATKSGIAALGEGIRSDLLGQRGHDIVVTTLFPGYIESEMNDKVTRKMPLMVDNETGCRSMVKAIQREGATAIVPPWPWRAIAVITRNAPLRLVRRFT
ncbi:hypothetical protein SAMN05444157_0353 [Frankineae bacterium MT45]|nr:hypothetical protein SAMN05444157_0353 [Frankineae bacterium MT45]